MLTAFAGSFFDGKSSRPHDVQVQLDPHDEHLTLRGLADGQRRYPLTELRVAPRVGNTPRFIYFADGASLETRENDAVDELVPALPHGRTHLAQHRLESKLRWVLAMLALTIGLGWAMIEYGVPYAAEKVAFALPREVDEQLGNGALKVLDELVFEASTLSAADRGRLDQTFVQMVERSDLDADQVRLEFRASPVMGANALALPSGIVVMTDELVRLARNDEEVLAVLAHEIGHLRERHSLRGVLQNSTVALMIATITGDLASLTSIAATVPTVMVQLKYSRSFELEADDYAVAMMEDMDIDPTRLGDILIRLTGEVTDDEDDISDYLATHPGSAERMQRIIDRLAKP